MFQSFRSLSCAGVVIFGLTTLVGCGRGLRNVPGIEKFSAGVLNGYFLMTFKSTTLKTDFGGTFPLPGLKGSLLSIEPQLSTGGKEDGTLIRFSQDLSVLTESLSPYPYSGLPDGRPLPGVSGGALPRWDIDIGKYTLSVYLSDEGFGLYFPLRFLGAKGFELLSVVSVPIEDDHGNLIGTVYAIPRYVSGSGSGLFILIPFIRPSR